MDPNGLEPSTSYTCEAGALPTELWTQNTNLIVLNFDVGVKGIDRNWARMLPLSKENNSGKHDYFGKHIRGTCRKGGHMIDFGMTAPD